MARVAALVLAAGRGTRFGAGPDDSKLVALLGGKPLVRHVVDAALAASARPVFVVTGHAAAKITAAVAGLPVEIVHNPDYAQGLSHSVRHGLAALPADTDGIVILLADMPRVSASVIECLIRAFGAATKRPLAVVPVHDGVRGNPVLIGRGLFTALAAIEGDRGARGLLDGLAPPELLDVPIDDVSITLDVDTRAALRDL